MLRMKLDENKDFYDFKYIKRELSKPEQDKIYLTDQELDKLIN